MYGKVVWMKLAPSGEHKWKGKSGWMDKWKWKSGYMIRKQKGGLKHLDIWMGSHDICFLLFLVARNVYYLLIDVGRRVNKRMKWIGK